MKFLLDTLGMRVLRHEEFSAGCEAQCNGPYDGRWSKTMVGYAAEAAAFALEITYNYTHKQPYKKGNDLAYVEVTAPEQTLARVRASDFPCTDGADGVLVQMPEGYNFKVLLGSDDKSAISAVHIRVQNLGSTASFYTSLLRMKPEDKKVTFDGAVPFSLHFEEIATPIDYAEAGGRFAIAVADPAPFEAAVEETDGSVHTSLVELETPGKASVRVVILKDPDGSEVCVVNEDGFSALSQVDENATEALKMAIEEDKSDSYKPLSAA